MLVKLKRVQLFKLISLLIPVLILCLVELSLRVFHYGQDLSLFVEYPADHNYLILNPAASQRYFTNQAIATTGNIEPFRKQKGEQTLRIFVLGESTTIGYPYFHNGSFHRWLQYRLMRSFPDRDIEVINLSLTAVNSYTVLGFAKELINYKPDAVLIYSGHNEYYGALGVGSTDRIGGNRYIVEAVLRLRELRVVQLMTNSYEGVARLWTSRKGESGKTRMELMVGNQQIGYRSALYYKGISQFSTNMDEALHVLHSAHIPVFISSLVSNEKDLKPFISAPVDSLRFPGFKQHYDLGLAALSVHDSGGALIQFSEANSVFPGHALCNYYLGRLTYGKGDIEAAKQWFSNARDLDNLRFRAPDTLNTIIRGLCGRYDNTYLVDTKAAFEARSESHIIGNELILEHVHPNLAGYALMSDAFYLVMKRQGIFTIPPDREMSFARLTATMPITKVDSLSGAYKIFNLKSSWPFGEGLPKDSLHVNSEEEELAFNLAFRHTPWQEAMGDLYDYYIKEHDLAGAKTVMESLVLEHPTEEAYYEKAGNVCGEGKDYDNALYYFKKAYTLSPSFDKARYIFVMDLKLDRPGDALAYLDYAMANNPSGMNLAPIKRYAEEIIQWQTVAERDSTDASLYSRIANAYLKMGNQEGAAKYLQKATKAGTVHKPFINQ